LLLHVSYTYITPRIKATLRRKNTLMRAGRVEQTSASVVNSITSRNEKWLSRYTGKIAATDMWLLVLVVPVFVVVVLHNK